ncbi:helix-turn-helix domain-containing protein [Dellaglioa sp. BT-FLS60]
MFQMTLGDLRRHIGCTVEELSEILDIDATLLVNYEKDSSNIPMNLLIKIEKLYGISADYVFLGKEVDFKVSQNKIKN